jgi:hypothetical protein
LLDKDIVGCPFAPKKEIFVFTFSVAEGTIGTRILYFFRQCKTSQKKED